MLLLLLLLYTHIFNTTNSDSCAHCFVACTIENKYLKKKKKLETKLTKAIIFGIFLLSKPPYFLNTKSGKQRTAHIYMRYLGQVATNWVHTWYKKKSQLFFLSHHWSLFVVTEANNTITMKDAWRDCEVSVFVFNKNINFSDDVWTPGRTINVRYSPYNRGEAVIGSTWVIIGSWSQGQQVTGIRI